MKQGKAPFCQLKKINRRGAKKAMGTAKQIRQKSFSSLLIQKTNTNNDGLQVGGGQTGSFWPPMDGSHKKKFIHCTIAKGYAIEFSAGPPTKYSAW